MIKETSAKLLRELELALDRLTAQERDPLERLVQSLKLVREALQKLKQVVLQNPFNEAFPEAYFFKYIKPAFYCQQIYCTEMYTIETGLPFGDSIKQVSFLESEVSYLDRYLNKYAFLYQYFKLDAKDLDNLYFVRGVSVQSILLPQVPEPDPNFSTSCDYLFSKFRAYDMLKAWLLEKLLYLKGNPNQPISNLNTLKTEDLFWTGDAINLAELGYGLYHSGQLNNGTAGIGQIFRWLEEKLKITIGVPAKRFAEIRGRKRLSRTKFIDELKDGIIRKLDQEENLANKGNRQKRDKD
jgi:hypothetical protein